MAKPKTPTEEKFEKQDFDLFEALSAIDRKDYGYYDRLTDEQKKKFVPFMILHWISTVKGSGDLQSYYLQSVNLNANKYLFDEHIQKNPKLQWLMLCASSPGLGKQMHQWIPHLKTNIVKLKENAKASEVKDYFAKVYSKADAQTIKELSELYVYQQNKKVRLAKIFPDMKLADIETLSELLTLDDIKKYEQDCGE